MVEKFAAKMLMPSIVLFELVATSIDQQTFETFERWKIAFTKADRLITPTANDYWETAKIIRRLYLQRREQESKLKTLRSDALIARLAVRYDCVLVTENVGDFEILQRIMPRLILASADEFFV